ncbi:MAG: hypothetical protein HY868_23010 [Chloroflexi bacterium]|nr:hypothetical protein [Chloroflexota bacterium]
MKERSYVIAIVVVLAICCLGVYVAVTGYLNSQPSTTAPSTSGVIASPVVTVLPTETIAPSKPVAVAPVISATTAPAPSPLGAIRTITAVVPTQPIAPVVAARPSATPAPPPPATTVAPASPACSGFAYCWSSGVPDSTIGPGGNECPANYIFGRVVDSGGRGIPNMQIRFRDPTGISAGTTTKSPPDPAGAYNIPTGQPGSIWELWLEVNGNQASNLAKITTQRYTGAGNCPNRVDFIQQK